MVVPHDDRFNLKSFTLQAMIFPTTPDKGMQGILNKWDHSKKKGYGMLIDDKGCLTVGMANDKGKVAWLSSGKPLLRKVWYLAAATYDAETGKLKLY